MKCKAKKKTRKSYIPFWRKWWFIGSLIVVLSVIIYGAAWYVKECKDIYTGEDIRIYIPHGSNEEAISDTLNANLGAEFSKRVMRIWNWRDGNPNTTTGSYVIKSGMSALDASRKLIIGAQDPIKITFNNIRTIEQLAEKISAKMELSASDFMEACDSVLPDKGYNRQNYVAAFVPDTYEFYWSADAPYVIKRLSDIRDKYWTKEKTEIAEKLGLTTQQVATLASIVEEETIKRDERPTVARLYLNRLKRGMKLQADPTVKFAYGDFTLRRITHKHLATDSPYNTYQHEGLPPGPIRMVERETLDAVLYAPEHDYLYMCAKEDFSGYHNFAHTGSEHEANARSYHAALNKRNIR